MKRSTNRLAGALRWLGIDGAVFYTLLSLAWNAGAGLLTIVFVTRFLSPELQGYYYTFYSLIALQVFMELGLTFAIVQFASHEMAHLSWSSDGTVTGSAGAVRRLQSLLSFALSWFAVAAVLIVIILLPAGLYFFEATAPADIPANVRTPWALLVLFTALNCIVTAAMAILEGCGKVAPVARLRLGQSMIAFTTAWIVLSQGGELYALAANSLMSALIGVACLWLRHRAFFLGLYRFRTLLAGMNWRREIWPFHWRIALSWVSGYLGFQLFTPILFATHGPVAAGQMGLSLQIIGGLNGLALAWITTKVPTYGQLVASGQRRALDALFFRGLAQSFALLSLGIVIVLLVLHSLWAGGSPYAQRVLPFQLFSTLCIVCLANHVVFAEASYLRAHKEEPFLLPSIVGCVGTAILLLLLVPAFGLPGAVYSYTATTLLVGLGGGTAIFLVKRRQWAASARGHATIHGDEV